MSFTRSILGRIFATWALLLFVVTMIIFLVPFFLFIYPVRDPLRIRRFIKYARVWMRIYLTLIGCPFRVKGRKHFQKGESYIVICNHNSLMDVPLTSPGIPGANKTIAKQEMAKIPLFGIMYRFGSVLVDRKSEKSRKESFTKMKEVLDMGLHMCIYPEGTRNKTDQPLKSFHDGAFRLAKETGHAIIPAVIFNTRKVLPADRAFFLWPHRLRMDFLPPIPVEKDDSVESLKEKSFDVMRDYFVRNQ